MSAPVIQGWCPGALRPMMSGDGLVVRVRPRNNTLAAQQAIGLAKLALAHGHRFLRLSNLANVPLRGVTPGCYPALLAPLTGLGLVDDTPAPAARPHLRVNPLHVSGFSEVGTDPNVAVANSLAAALAAPDAPRLPGKFGFLVDLNRGVRELAGEIGDIRIESAEAGWGDFILRADGMPTGRLVTRRTAASLAVEMARWFVASGGVGADGRGRMRDCIARGAQLPDHLAGDVAPARSAIPPQPGSRGEGRLIAFAFGQVHARKLIWLAQTGGGLRLTPWRMVYLVPDILNKEHLGMMNRDFITSAADPLLRVTACTGAPGCPQGHAPTRALARTLADAVPEGAMLHVSGCAKGCAHPGPAMLTLVARKDGAFDLVRNGRSCDRPTLTALRPDALMACPDLLTETHNAP